MGPMSTVLELKSVNKTYGKSFQALQDINLKIEKGEIFALLGPNGAGKTTLINAVCGLIRLTSGSIKIGGFDSLKDFRKARKLIGLVPQELTTDAFEKVIHTVSFSRGLFGYKPDPDHIEKVLRSLSLWDKRNNKLFTLSGGMKRRVMIAKALSHHPEVLFLDEPTAGVDVQLRESMWEQLTELKKLGVTIILTTHYIEEAERMADRIGIINNGHLVQVDEKRNLIERLGKKTIKISLKKPLPSPMAHQLNSENEYTVSDESISYEYNSYTEADEISELFKLLVENNVSIGDVETHQSSLQDIFVDIVGGPS